jgi:hypothetical protein
MTYPPFIKSMVWVVIETLFGRRCFREGVGHVGTVYEEILRGRDGVEHARACLVDAICICFVENMGLASTERTIAYHASLLAIAKGLDAVGPYSVEYSCVIVN